MGWLAFALCWCLAPPPVLDPNRAEFPDSSLVDYGARRNAPFAHGYLSISPDGHFVTTDGQRVRFWGINVASESVFQPTERIDTCIERIRRAGFNLVRIHHIDGTARGIITGGADSLTFDQAKLRQLDYWIAHLGRAGIGVYLDLLDYRSFLPGDGVPLAAELGRGAKPYALFDERLIQLQQRYAKALLRDHVNTFNGLPYADDPTVVLLELFDENGLFIRRSDWPTLVEPYRAELTRRWNRYLAERYGTTAKLVAAWGQSGAPSPVPDGQRVESGSLELPALILGPDKPANSPAARLHRAKCSEAARFAATVHRDYYRRMRTYLRQVVGVQTPLTAVGDATVVPDLLAISQELDFVGLNYYWDHPIFRAGQDWQSPFLFHYRNPLASLEPDAFAPKLALAKLTGRPVVVREWSPCFPNPYRAAGMVEATAYAALQDVDAMILFTYGAVDSARQIGCFDVHQDPARWGLAGTLGEVFLSGAVSPARRSIELGYSETDTYLFKEYRSSVRNLAYLSRVATRCFRDELRVNADLTLASGRSGQGRYLGGPVLLSRNDPAASTNGDTAPTTAGYLGYSLPLQQGTRGDYWFDGDLLFDRGTHERRPGGRFSLRALQHGALAPLGRGQTDAVGFRDDWHGVFGFGPLSGDEQVAAAADILKLIYGDQVGRQDLARQRLVSDTGQLSRDVPAGRMLVKAPRVLAVAGDLTGGPFGFGGITLETATERGAAVLVSLDGRPLDRSGSLVARLVGKMVNSRMEVSPPGPQNNPRWLYVASSLGVGPVLSDGRAVAAGWRFKRGGVPWFSVGLSGGSAEVVAGRDGWRFYVDTPDAWVWAAGVEHATAVAPDGTETALPGGGPWRMPETAAMVTMQ